MTAANTETARVNQKQKKGLPVVVYFDHTAVMSGGEIALYNLVITIDQDSFTPVVVLGAEGPLADKLRATNIEVHVLPLAAKIAATRKDSLKKINIMRIGTGMRSIIYSLKLARLICARKADLLHTNSLKADLLGGIAARMARVPVIWHIRDRISDDYLPALAVKLFRMSCRVLPDYIIANSRATISTLATGMSVRSAVVHSGSANRHISVVHDGIPDPLLSNYQSELSRPVIGLVGRISEWKGQHVFIDAANEILKTYPNARFRIIGSAMFGEEKYEERIRAQVAAQGIDDSIEFCGFVSDIAGAISQLDVLVHASTVPEPFGQVVIEGMVAGKPVVATSGGGVLEIVVEDETGYLVPMGNSEDMAKAIKNLLDDPEKAKKMGSAGRERVLEHFTIDITARKIQEIYKEILREGKNGS